LHRDNELIKLLDHNVTPMPLRVTNPKG
jgi:hypothetical protein